MHGLIWGLVLMVGSLGCFGMAQAQALKLPQLSIAAVAQAINPGCIGLHVAGPCLCGGVTPGCVQMTYHVPTHLVTVTKHPEHQLLDAGVLALILGDEAAEAVRATLGSRFPFGGSGGTKMAPDGVRTHHFWDVRVFSVPAALFHLSSLQAAATGCLQCDPADARPGALHYDSRLDLTWRLDVPSLPGLADVAPTGAGPLGIWGRLTPLSGFIVHVSAPTAAAAIATRAMHAVLNPAHGRLILSPSVGGPPTCFQPGWPQLKPCMRVGTHPAQWEHHALDHTQTALFFFWAKRACCVEPARLACATGLTALGGGPGEANFCPYPLLSGGFAPGLVPDIGAGITLPALPGP